MNKSVDNILEECITKGSRKSFFLFAGAGSGKTHSLVVLLNKIRDKWEQKFKIENRHVAVITYTNAATDEIISRLNYSPLFHVSTIHSFVWNVIQSYQSDIKKYYLRFKEEEKAELEEKINKARKKDGKTYLNNVDKFDKVIKSIAKIETVHKFIYNPNGNNFEYNALSHAEVIKIGAKMIVENKLLQEIIAQQYPFLLIDESQDTKKELVQAFFELERNFGGENFTLGFIGDQKQRIYTDGEERITTIIPKEWETPVKPINYRCDKRIIKLSNKISESIEQNATQNPRENAEEGFVHLFLIRNNDEMNKFEKEANVVLSMKELTGDDKWSMEDNNVKILTLEHMMAARRLGFEDFLGIMRRVDKYSQTLLQGKVDDMDVFTKLSFPLIDSLKKGDNLSALNLLKSYSPLLINLAPDKAYETLSKCRKILDGLQKMDLGRVTIKEFLKNIVVTNLFNVPQLLIDALSVPLESLEEQNDKVLYAWCSVMNLPVIQIVNFNNYINGNSMFGTHQGVKGLEFDRVLVIIDEKESNMPLFNYNKLFGVEPLSTTDINNRKEGKETTIERTMRLFYVACTRARHSLAIAIYTDNPEIIKQTVTRNGWFDSAEISIM